MKKKKVLILGSTGSIGRATLEVIAEQQDIFEVYGLACNQNVGLLNEQVARFSPPYIGLSDAEKAGQVCARKGAVLTGMDGIREMIAMEADIVVNALPGSVGLIPTMEALGHDKILALSNKESLVMAGRLILEKARQGPATLLPVDSEHSALYQLIRCVSKSEIRNLIITASGGPFRNHSREEMEQVKPSEALNHPTWKMGAKVTLDSATLMNKGLEVIEARWLFDVPPERIQVLVHPESVLHGIVELVDGSFLAHMAMPDMKIPISYALNGGSRLSLPWETIDFGRLGGLSFFSPDTERFPSLRLAFEALKGGDGMLITLNAANEVASRAFIDHAIRFTDIPVFIEKTMERAPWLPVIEDLDTILEVHRWAMEETQHLLRR